MHFAELDRLTYP